MLRLYPTLFIGVFWLCCVITVTAQSTNQKVQDVVMPAPNAAALGKYGDIPVSYFTGVPNVDIPITTVQEGPLSLPISLSYHASGVRVNEMASWVGIGWSLNAGGLITRTIQGLADEVGSSVGYYHTGSTLSLGSPGSAGYAQTLASLAGGSRDGEPDLFSFNAAGLSGKFYIDKDKNIQLVPKQDLKIELQGGSSFDGFIITTTDGTRYIFGKVPGASTLVQEKSMTSGEGVSTTTSWYLMKIETADKLYYINFSYVNENYAYKSPATCRDQSSTCTTGNGTSGSSGVVCSTDVGYDAYHRYLTTQITGKRLSQITVGSATTTVNFTANTLRTDLYPSRSGLGIAI
ncbi:MAG: hypothetical protein WA952_18650 [Lewinella sp.]